MKGYVEEANTDGLFRQLWSCEAYKLFRPYASAALAFGHVADRSRGARIALYRDIATSSRSGLLDRLSGLQGWKGRLSLLPRTDYAQFSEADWRALFAVTDNAVTRRTLGHLKSISPMLVRQIALVPEQIRIPAIVAVLNSLEVSPAHWLKLAAALGDTPPRLLPSLLGKARRVNSIGSFWDYFFECVDRLWKPFVLPDQFLRSPMLKPLRTLKELGREGRRMQNCLASKACRVRAGRRAYFRWQGGECATVELVYSGGWRVGSILGSRNTRLAFDVHERIRWWANLLVAGLHEESAPPADSTVPAVRALCDRARAKFGIEACESLAAALREIRGKTKAFGWGMSAYCVFSGEEGYVQLMADTRGAEFLCEIQSHHFHAPVERRLTNAAVTLISECGFAWPVGEQNFSRWFSVDTEADVDSLAQFCLGVLGEVFGHPADRGVSVTVEVPG
jgi:hypothetical protein